MMEIQRTLAWIQSFPQCFDQQNKTDSYRLFQAPPVSLGQTTDRVSYVGNKKNLYNM